MDGWVHGRVGSRTGGFTDGLTDTWACVKKDGQWKVYQLHRIRTSALPFFLFLSLSLHEITAKALVDFSIFLSPAPGGVVLIGLVGLIGLIGLMSEKFSGDCSVHKLLYVLVLALECVHSRVQSTEYGLRVRRVVVDTLLY